MNMHRAIALAAASAAIRVAAADLNPAAVPTDRMTNEWWAKRHEAKLADPARAGCRLLFLGDSITQGWEGPGKAVWDRYYAHRAPFNLGFSGDRTEHVLWRLDHGEIDGMSPELVILMLGTNNTGHRKDPPDHTTEGMKLILDRLTRRLPQAKVLLLAVFPREARPDGELRRINDALNERLKALADGERVIFVDINAKFLAPDGSLPTEIMPDFLHPKEQGYAIWAAAIEPWVSRILGDTPVAP